jgi:hypothetical protein
MSHFNSKSAIEIQARLKSETFHTFKIPHLLHICIFSNSYVKKTPTPLGGLPYLEPENL